MVPAWLRDIAVVVVTAVVIPVYVLVFAVLPVPLLGFLPAPLVERLCMGAFFCLPTVAVLGTVSVALGLALLARAYDRGYLWLPEMW